MLGAVMPFWHIDPLVRSAILAVARWHHHGIGLVVTSSALLIVSVIMSNRWDPYHYVCVAVIIAAFTLLVAALA